MGTFRGIPTRAFTFYAELAEHNNKPWWNEHKCEYETSVRAPLIELCAALEDEFGPAKVYRPYRDARFAKDKSPLKDHQGAVIHIEDHVGYYVQVSASGLMIAGGWYAPQGRQLERYRAAVDTAAGVALERLVAALGKKFELNGNPLKTKPKGYDADHPRIELLRNRMLTAARNYGDPAWVNTPRTLKVVRDDWRALQPLLEWLADHVGPGEEPE